jgi:hypothetical protein
MAACEPRGRRCSSHAFSFVEVQIYLNF